MKWKDIHQEGCRPMIKVEEYLCGKGFREQNKTCSRTLGGKYCQDEDGNDVAEDIIFRTDMCEANPCPGQVSRLQS